MNTLSWMIKAWSDCQKQENVKKKKKEDKPHLHYFFTAALQSHLKSQPLENVLGPQYIHFMLNIYLHRNLTNIH